jgi:hypothetical protein
MNTAGKGLIDKLKFAAAFQPVDWNTPGTPDYVNLKNYGHVTIVLMVGNLAGDIDFTLLQATDVNATGEKELVFSTAHTWQIADTTAAGSGADTVTSRTVTNSGATGAKVTLANASDDNMILFIEIDEDDLDVNNGFTCLKVAATDPAAAGLLSCLYILSNGRYGGDGTVMPSAVV